MSESVGFICRCQSLVRDARAEFRVGASVAGGIYKRRWRKSRVHGAGKSGADGGMARRRRRQRRQHTRDKGGFRQRNDSLPGVRGRGVSSGRALGDLQVLGDQQRRRRSQQGRDRQSR